MICFGRQLRRALRKSTGTLVVLFLPAIGVAQQTPEKSTSDSAAAASKTEAAEQTPEKVEVKPLARDDEIAGRLTRILNATDWFREPEVTVNEGMVFLKGRTDGEPFKKWAGDLARNTRDVVAVVNRIEVDDPPLWDSSEVRGQLTSLGRSTVRGLPILVFALVVLPAAWLVSRFLSRISRRLLKHSVKSELLLTVTARGIGLVVFLVAIYLVLQVSGLTRLALTLMGGTGLLGLALGIAFKEITENFLASIYLSIQKPFEIGDQVEINAMLGYVQRVTARTTILMTVEGNHVQIPNATVFKSTLQNFTSNANRRVDFVIGIGYDTAVADAQSTALQVLHEHPAVLKDPEPWVLVDGLAASTVNLRVYFWLNGKQHSWLKVRSALIRLTKGAFQKTGISLPDESREVLFPNGVPVHLIHRRNEWASERMRAPEGGDKGIPESQPVSSAAEGGLSSEAGEIEEQARRARMPEAGENLFATVARARNDKPDSEPTKQVAPKE